MWDDCEGIGRLRDGREVLRTKEGTRHAQERKMIVRRVKAGLAARKAKGLRLGRVPLPMCLLRFPIQQLPPERTTFRAAWNTPQIAADCPPRG